MVGAIRTAALEVKFLDRCKTNNSESIWQERFHRSRTKVKGSKTIRYRRSPNLVTRYRADKRWGAVVEPTNVDALSRGWDPLREAEWAE